MEWEPYGENNGLIYQETDQKRAEKMAECLEDGELSNHSDDSIGSFEIVGKLEYSSLNDGNVSEGSEDMELERYTKKLKYV